MTRLYSSFDLGKIVADEDARREQERKDADAAARRAAIAEKRADRQKTSSSAVVPDAVSGVVALPAPLIVPVSVSLQQLDLSKFRLGEAKNEYHLFGLPLGETFVDLALTKAHLYGGDSLNQLDWYDHPEYRTIEKIVYDLPSGPEFEAIVEAAAAYHPVGDEQFRLRDGLLGLVFVDLVSRALSRSRVRFAATGVDELSSHYGMLFAQTMNLKGLDVPITPQASLDAEFGVLLGTTTARYCAARKALGVAPGMLLRWEQLDDGKEWPLSVGGNVGIYNDGRPARGVRYLSQKDAGGRS